MKVAGWTYELPPVGAASEGLEDYEARTAEGWHAGVVVGLVQRNDELFLLVDAGRMPPFVHRRIAVCWHDVTEVDHASLAVELAFDRTGLEEAALALDPRKAVHGPGAEAARMAGLPDVETVPHPPEVEGPVVERQSVFVALALAAAWPIAFFALVAVWTFHGLAGWEYGLLVIPLVLAAASGTVEGYRLYREPHVRPRIRPQG